VTCHPEIGEVQVLFGVVAAELAGIVPELFELVLPGRELQQRVVVDQLVEQVVDRFLAVRVPARLDHVDHGAELEPLVVARGGRGRP
jgi:hypothetical protein